MHPQAALVGVGVLIGLADRSWRPVWLTAGAAAPKLVRREHLSKMKPGSVLVDVSIDQGGCFETSHPTTHAEPTFVVDGIVHYCVANMPGAVARTSTFALNNVTLPFALDIANKGAKAALKSDPHLAEDADAGLDFVGADVEGDSEVVAQGAALTVPRPRLWSPDDPALYRLRVDLDGVLRRVVGRGAVDFVAGNDQVTHGDRKSVV